MTSLLKLFHHKMKKLCNQKDKDPLEVSQHCSTKTEIKTMMNRAAVKVVLKKTIKIINQKILLKMSS